MSPDWSKQALVGTAQFHAVLHHAAHADLQSRSSHHVATHRRPAEPRCPPEKLMPPQAVAYFGLLMSGVHELALPEWLKIVHDEGSTLHYEVIRFLMHNYDETYSSKWYRPHIRYLMSQYLSIKDAPSIQSIKGSYAFLFEMLTVQASDAPDFLAAQQAKQANMIEALRTHTEDIPLFTFSELLWPWSLELTELFLENLLANKFHRFNDYILEQGLKRYSYFFALDMDSQLLRSVLQLMGHRNYDQEKHHVEIVLDFRQHMVTAIKGETR